MSIQSDSISNFLLRTGIYKNFEKPLKHCLRLVDHVQRIIKVHQVAGPWYTPKCSNLNDAWRCIISRHQPKPLSKIKPSTCPCSSTGPPARGKVPLVSRQRHGSQPLLPEGSGARAWKHAGPAGGNRLSVNHSLSFTNHHSQIIHHPVLFTLRS